MSAHSLLNVESIAALGFLIALLVRSRNSAVIDHGSNKLPIALVFVGICAAILIVYWHVLSAPFLFDDYTHITDARNATWEVIAAAFGPVENPPGLFYRPFGFLVYWLNYLAAGEDPRWWHAVSLSFHAVNCCVLYTLCLRSRLPPIGSLGAALVFALSGVTTESVAWIDARFDPMATGLVLATLVGVCRFVEDGRWWNLLGAGALAAMAVTSKESAFCLPLLIGCLWFFRPADARRLLIAFLVIGALVTAIFAYRFWALDGIGGYRDPGGGDGTGIGRFSLVRMLNAIFIRDWTILFFPLNWSGSPGWTLKAFLASAPVILAVTAWKVRLPRRAVIGCLALTTAAALPVEHLLLIGTDLANTRYLYLPAAGYAILWGITIAQARARAFLLIWIVAFELLMTSHNLQFWLRIPEEAKATCVEFARTIEHREGPAAVVGGLPQKKDGVVFLANGFPECVAMNSHVPASRVSVQGKPDFLWNPASGHVEPLR